MRYHRLRFDIWLCLLFAYLVGMGVGAFVDYITAGDYEKYEKAHTVAAGDIGGKANDDVFRAQSVEELLAHDTFTIISTGIQYRNEGAGYFDGKYLYSVLLPSGERVAAYINGESVQFTGEDIYTGDSILPVGCIKYADLEAEKNFIEQIEHKETLSRKDFYIDMVGESAKMSEEDYATKNKIFPQVISGIFAFGLVHMLGSKIGIFPPFFSFRKKKSEWD